VTEFISSYEARRSSERSSGSSEEKDLKERTIEALQRAFEAAGVEFIDEDGAGPGVRLRTRERKKKV
jgi:hypothetical protein